MASYLKRLISFLLLVTLTSALSVLDDSPFDIAPLEARQSDPIAAWLNQENTDLQILQNYINSLSTTSPLTGSQFLQLQKDFNNVLNDIKNATTACQNSAPLTAASCKNDLNLLTQLYNLAKAVLNNVVAHKPAFTSGGLINVICNDLKQLATAFAGLFACLEKQCCSNNPQCGFFQLASQYAAAFQAAENSLGC